VKGIGFDLECRRPLLFADYTPSYRINPLTWGLVQSCCNPGYSVVRATSSGRVAREGLDAAEKIFVPSSGCSAWRSWSSQMLS
jgi:hypothetical protein